ALAAFGGDHLRVPRGVPDDLDVGIGYARKVEQLHAGIGGDRCAHAAAGGGQRHLDVDPLSGVLGCDAEIVDEAEVDDVHRDLRVVAGPEHAPDLLLEVAARHSGCRWYGR